MTPRFQRVLFVAALSGLLSTGTLVAGVTAGAAVPLKAALSLTPRTSAVGQLVTAHVNRSTQPAGDRIKRITLRWGDRTAAVSVPSLASTPKHRYAGVGRFTVTVAITDIHGKTVQASALEVVHAFLPPAGSYTAFDQQNGNPIRFFVSQARTRLQDVSVSFAVLTCAPGGAAIGDHFGIANIAIAPDGSFAGTAAQQGVQSGFPASYTYVFRGHYLGLNAAGVPSLSGSLRETLTFTDTTARTCTTNVQPWTGTRDVQPAQSAVAPPAGSYTASDFQNGNPIKFFVAQPRTSLQDVSFNLVGLSCAPGGAGLGEHFGIDTLPLQPDGSFAKTVTQSGVFNGFPATFTYTLRGHFHSLASSGAERAAGTFRETITFTDTTARTCTTNDQPWAGTRDAQPAQSAVAPPPGSYTASDFQNGNPIKFFVAQAGTSLQDVSFNLVGLSCAPGGAGLGEHFGIDSVPLQPDGSFTQTVAKSGVFNGFPATFTYTFRGQFHSLAPAGAERAAGTFRETIEFTDTAARTCTTNDQPWAGTRDAQPPQTAAAPTPGPYSGSEFQNGNPMTFTVSPDSTTMQNVAFTFVGMTCTPGGSTFGDHFTIATIPVNPDRSFTQTVMQSGLFNGLAANFTYTVRGNFHSAAPSGAERAAGTYRETVTFTDTALRTCTTNDQPWTALKSP